MSISTVPDVAEILAPVLAQVEESDRPMLLAMAERMAAERYRHWAAAAGTGYDRDRLLACADREDEIAVRIESLRGDHEAVQERIHQRIPNLGELTLGLFQGRPMHEQFAIQARGERLGAATWRALARGQTQEAARATLLACADLEEVSALVLEAMLAEHPS